MSDTHLAVFSDLDGTLLDHHSYSYAAAEPALHALKAHCIPLVLASSKTAAEIQALHRELGLDTPAIVENGAGLFVPGAPETGSEAYGRIRAALNRLPAALRAHFTGFGDMRPDALSDLTGLPPEGATRAQERRFSEPGLWSGTETELTRFLTAMAEHGIHARRGGRFLTLSFGATKRDQMAAAAKILGTKVSIALGDAPNDLEMLEAADHGVIVRNDHGPEMPPLAGEAKGRISRTEQEGPAGWNTAVLGLLMKLGYR